MKRDINQTKCWIATHGWMWMEGFFDRLPPRVRARLRASPFNLCPACLVTEFLPPVQAQYPGYSREKALLAAIDVMESQLRDGGEIPPDIRSSARPSGRADLRPNKSRRRT